jgi:beta-glucanase (GH16 family)
MKKITIVFTLLFTLLGFIACQSTTTNPLTTTISTSSSSSSGSTTISTLEPTTSIPTTIPTTTIPTTTSATTTLSTTLPTTSTTMTTTLDPNSLLANIPVDCFLAPIEQGWIPVWCEEFNYTGPVDPTKWKHQVGGGGFGNQELQYYTSRPENAIVDGEKLIITAFKETYGGHAYTSSKIWTQGLHNFKYGKFEIRAKVPAGLGTWPAFWMMPKSSVYGGWPNSGEIDILEHVGNNLDSLLGTIHTGKYNHMTGTQIGFTRVVQGLSEDFHVYSMTWNEHTISWQINGLNYGTTTFNPGANLDVETYMAWPFDQEFYLILNLAMGGGLGGSVDPNFISDRFEIDYVRVYQKDHVTGDTIKPFIPTDIEALRITPTSAYLIWTRAFDNRQIKYYNIYVNGVLNKKATLNTWKMSSLLPNTTYMIEIESEDYAGNRSAKVPFSFTTSIE